MSRKPKKKPDAQAPQAPGGETKPKGRRFRPWFRTLILVGGTFLLLGVVYGSQYVTQWWAVAALNGHVEEYLAEPKQTAPTRKAHLRGKLVPVDVETRKVSDLYYDLPEEVRAATPEDVGTVAWIHWETSTVGKEGKEMPVRSCKVTLIDLPASVVMEEVTFRSIGKTDEKAARKPVVDFLSKLPRVKKAGP